MSVAGSAIRRRATVERLQAALCYAVFTIAVAALLVVLCAVTWAAS